MNILSVPLLDPMVVGVILLMAGITFALPSKMEPFLRTIIALLIAILGLIYVWDAIYPFGPNERATLVRLTLFSIGVTFATANISALLYQRILDKNMRKLHREYPVGDLKNE
jgi:hypothetical protein